MTKDNDVLPVTKAVAICEEERASILPVFSGEQIAGAVKAYREVQKALDLAMPDQIMDFQGRPFRCKGYWRAVKAAFGIAVHCTFEERITREKDWGYIVTYRASKGPLSCDGDGACFAAEKICYKKEKVNGYMKKVIGKDGKPVVDELKTMENCTEHNVRGHAHTRAFNRAVSNLVGFGEVSAEEMTREEKDGTPAPAKPGTIEAAKAAYGRYKDAYRKNIEAGINKIEDIFPEPDWSEYDEAALVDTIKDINKECDSLAGILRAKVATAYFEGKAE